MSNLETMFAKSGSPAEFARSYAKYLGELLAEVDYEAVERVIEVFEAARAEGKAIFFVGNGGSAATASHFATDLGLANDPEHGRSLQGVGPFRAWSLTDSVPWLTAVANDTQYGDIFTRQLQNHFGSGDVVVGVSASGNSSNVLKAIEYANRNGGVSVALVGFDGGALKKIAHYCVHVRSSKGEYGPVEDIHLILDHIISGYFRMRLASDR